MKNDRISDYKTFWAFYLKEHKNKKTRLWHFVGTSLGLTFLVLSAIKLSVYFLLLGFVSGYAFAWYSHFFIEKNKPATFKYPWWSFISDWKMWFYMLTGKLESELKKYNV